MTLTTIGRTRPSSFCWSRSALIQAPLCFESRGEIVADEQRDRRAVGADRLPGARVGVRRGHVVARDEGDAEQAMGDVEGGGDHRFQRQIGPELALVDVVERLATLLGIVAPIPWLKLEVAALGGDHRLQRFRLTQSLRARRRPHAAHQLERRFRRLGHRVGEAEGGEARKAEQARALGAQRDGFAHDRRIVVRAAACAARDEGAKRPFAQVASGRELHERLVGRARQRHRMLAGKPTRGGRLRRRGDEALRQSGKIVRPVENKRERLFVGEHVLAEQGAEARQPLADRRQARLPLRVEARAGAGESDAPTFERPRRLGVESETVARLMQRLDAGEQRVVEHDRVALARQNRRDVAFDALDLVAGLGAGEMEERRAHPLEKRAGALQGDDRVVEGRRGGIGDDRRDLGAPFGQRRVECGWKVLGSDAIERRRAERRVPRREQGIVGGRRELIHAGELGAAPSVSQPLGQPRRTPANDQCVWTIFDLAAAPRVDFGAIPAHRAHAASVASIRMARKSLTLVSVGPVTTRSPSAANRP